MKIIDGEDKPYHDNETFDDCRVHPPRHVQSGIASRNGANGNNDRPLPMNKIRQ